jgi:hypothetical protein
VEHAGGFIFATTTLNDDQWHHVAVTVAADANIADVKFYIDGVEDAMAETGGGTPAINTASGPIAIGRSVADDQTDRIFTGHIDEVRLWKKQLSAQEISDVYNTEICPDDHPDLVAYYKFNEGTGDTAYDETGNFNGTLGTGNKSDALPVWDDGATVTLVDCNGTAVPFVKVSDMFKVYPNPAVNQIRINTDRNIENLTIYDLSGLQMKCIKWYNDDDINISSFTPGIYLIRAVSDTQEISITKFIKK